ncbi:hypothetical protein JCM6882_006550 [Rhodosporidiobolus microsporus]
MGVPLPDDGPPFPSALPTTSSPPPAHSPPPPSRTRLPALPRVPSAQTERQPPWRTPTPLRNPILSPGSFDPPSTRTSAARTGQSDGPSAATTQPSRSRLPPPPSTPFDAPAEDSTTAWSHWLDERRQRRATLAAASATVGLPPTVRTPRSSVSNTTSERLDRLRQSAERLRSLDRRVDEITQRNAARRAFPTSNSSGSSSLTTRGVAAEAPSEAEPFSLSSSLDSSRQLLEQVRRRLDETRQRVDEASERVQRNTQTLVERAIRQDEEADRLLMDSRERMEWGASFIERLEQLIQTLTTLSERASALPDSLDSLSSAAPVPPWRLPPSSLPSSSPLETPSAAAATDSLRHTVRQLITASRRVSAAINQHRESITAAATRFSAPTPATSEETAASSSNVEEEHVPLLRTDVPLPVSLPSPSSPSRDTFVPPTGLHIPPINIPPVSPNPSGLLLPTSTGTFPTSTAPFAFPLTASPRPISPSLPSNDYPSPQTPHPLVLPLPAVQPHTGPQAYAQAQAQAQENYPGERAQLLRIAQLQRDIAARAGELRELRRRTEELEREQGGHEEETAAGGLSDEERESGGGWEGAARRAERRRAARAGGGNPWSLTEEPGEDEGEAKEEEDEEEGEEENEWDSLQREIEEDRARAEVRRLTRGEDGLSLVELCSMTPEEKRRRDYLAWARCGR